MKTPDFSTRMTLAAAVAILLAANCCSKQKPPNFVEPNAGVGAVRKGMTRQEAEDALGPPKQTDSTTSYYKGMWVLFNTNGVLFGVKCVKGFEGHTQEGVGVGSSRADVIKAYGAPNDDQHFDHGDENLWFSALNITFWVQRGKVTSFIVQF